MEKALIFLTKRFATEDGRGIRTTLFFKGCPLRCAWCHNPESWIFEPEVQYRQDICIRCGQCRETIETAEGVSFQNCPTGAKSLVGKWISLDEAIALVMRDRPFYDESNGGVTVSGGEPLMQSRFVKAFFQKLGQEGVHRTLDTSGFSTLDIFQDVLHETDEVIFDLKSGSSSLHKTITGHGNEKILGNLAYMDHHTVVTYTIRIPIIAGLNDSDEEQRHIMSVFKGLSRLKTVQLLPYHPWGLRKARAIGSNQDEFDSEDSEASCMRWMKQMQSDLPHVECVIGGIR